MAYEKQTWVDGQSRLSAERMNHIEDGIAGVSSNAVTINTDQTVTGKKEFTHTDGIGTNAVHNISGNAMLRYKETEDKIVVGSSTKPLTLMGSGDRPTYSKDGSDFSGSALAFKSEVDGQKSNWSLLWANLGIGRWRSQEFTYNSSYQSPNIDDNLLPYLTKCEYMFTNTTYEGTTDSTITTIKNNFADNVALNYGFLQCKIKGTLLLSKCSFPSINWAFDECLFTKIDFADNVDPWVPTNMYNCFRLANNLIEIGAFDFSGINNFGNECFRCFNLKKIHCTHFKSSFNISFSTAFEEADLVEILNNLDIVSTTETLTMGATNLAKLTTDDILIATGKGWQLA